jgi:hypothetical protein
MIIYFDESYDNAHNYLLYGALFVPPSSNLHRRFEQVRAETGFRGEVKYNKCRNPRALTVCTKVVDAFLADEAYFRCAVVDQHRFDYSWWGRIDESLAIKKARAYKKFAEMLLHPFVENLRGAVFLADNLKRCRGDDFLERIRERFNPPNQPPTFRHLAEVSSAHAQYQCLQVCDLLLGCVLNNLVPTKNRYKNEIRQYLLEKLAVPSFLLTTWKDVSLKNVVDDCPPINVWYWRPEKEPR